MNIPWTLGGFSITADVDSHQRLHTYAHSWFPELCPLGGLLRLFTMPIKSHYINPINIPWTVGELSIVCCCFFVNVYHGWLASDPSVTFLTTSFLVLAEISAPWEWPRHNRRWSTPWTVVSDGSSSKKICGDHKIRGCSTLARTPI